MRLYKVSIFDTFNNNGTKAVWLGTQGECATARKNFGAKGFARDHIKTEEIEVPTVKKELLEWLNKNAV